MKIAILLILLTIIILVIIFVIYKYATKKILKSKPIVVDNGFKELLGIAIFNSNVKQINNISDMNNPGLEDLVKKTIEFYKNDDDAEFFEKDIKTVNNMNKYIDDIVSNITNNITQKNPQNYYYYITRLWYLYMLIFIYKVYFGYDISSLILKLTSKYDKYKNKESHITLKIINHRLPSYINNYIKTQISKEDEKKIMNRFINKMVEFKKK